MGGKKNTYWKKSAIKLPSSSEPSAAFINICLEQFLSRSPSGFHLFTYFTVWSPWVSSSLNWRVRAGFAITRAGMVIQKAWTRISGWWPFKLSANPSALVNRYTRVVSDSSNQEDGITGLELGPCTAVWASLGEENSSELNLRDDDKCLEPSANIPGNPNSNVYMRFDWRGPSRINTIQVGNGDSDL